MCGWGHVGYASCPGSGRVGWHSLCLKNSRKVYSECTSAALCVTRFNAPYPSAAKQPQTSLESTLPLSIHAFPCIPQLPSLSHRSKPLLTINIVSVCQSASSEATVCLLHFCSVVCHPLEQSKLEKKAIPKTSV